MRCKGWLVLMWLMAAALPSLAVHPSKIAILYNSADPESKELAEFYAEARDIPPNQLVGLEMPKQAEITREQYNKTIADPLRQVFVDRKWMERRKMQNGKLLGSFSRMRVLVTMRGVPLKIRQSPRADGKPHPDRKKQPFKGHDEASVDSELAMLPKGDYELDGAQRSLYFRSKTPIDDGAFTGIILTCRIDAPTLATCKRMITDAIKVEQSGLWGFHTIDISKKYPQGDDWLEVIVEKNLQLGLPTTVDRFRETLPLRYPLKDAACYYGWYDWNLSGPMLNPDFRFRKGAVAIHIHSFSAQQLRNPKKNWSGGLLEAGAAVTVGNVYEPYLGLSHHLDVLHERLLEGHTWVDASWMAMPALSWQGITLGDPLYRPFAHLNGSGEVLDADREYRALREAMKRWQRNPAERIRQLKQAAIRMKSGIFFEALALESLEEGDTNRAGTLFVQARELYTAKPDQLRQELHRIAMYRRAGNKDLAASNLKGLTQKYQDLPELAAVKAWLKLVTPAEKEE